MTQEKETGNGVKAVGRLLPGSLLRQPIQHWIKNQTFIYETKFRDNVCYYQSYWGARWAVPLWSQHFWAQGRMTAVSSRPAWDQSEILSFFARNPILSLPASSTTLSSMVNISHVWLSKFELIKNQLKFKFFSLTSHVPRTQEWRPVG